jgi:hypothetical protein
LAALVETLSGIRLWLRSRRYDIVVTDARPHVAVFGVLSRLGLQPAKRHLMFECLWRYPEGRFATALKRLQVRASVTPRSRAIVYARRERHAFGSFFRVPVDRFVFIPYHTTLTTFDAPTGGPPLAQPYVFAGGDSERDYGTLCEAVVGLGLPVVIACRDRSPFTGRSVPTNVRVITTTHEDFLRWMYYAHVNVVPLRAGTLRSAGQQTFLNAMAFGTVVIVTDVEGGRDYVLNWENGILVPPGQPAALRVALDRLLQEPSLHGRIAAAACRARDDYTTEKVLSACLDFVESAAFEDRRVTAYLPLAGEAGVSME